MQLLIAEMQTEPTPIFDLLTYHKPNQLLKNNDEPN